MSLLFLLWKNIWTHMSKWQRDFVTLSHKAGECRCTQPYVVTKITPGAQGRYSSEPWRLSGYAIEFVSYMLSYFSVSSLEVGGCNIYQIFSSLRPLHPPLRQQIRPRSKHTRLIHKKGNARKSSNWVAFLHCKEPIPINRSKFSQKRNCAATA
jgi:hypothetical protein